MGVALHTAMFGGTRCGKTTLLVQMMSTIRKQLSDANMDLRIAQKTTEAFSKARSELSELVTRVYKGEPIGSIGVAGSTEVRGYGIGIDNSDGVTAAELIFHDYPGEYLEKLTKEESGSAELRARLSNANALLIAVNTPILMASLNREPEWHDLHLYSNYPDVLNNVFTEYDSVPNLVLFCPIKSERWLNDDPRGRDLLTAVEQGYRKPLRTLRRDHPNTRVMLIPVATCGSIEFESFETYGPPGTPLTINNVIEKFRPTAGGGPPGHDRLHPKFNDQPLRHLMKQVLETVDYQHLVKAYSDSMATRKTFEKKADTSLQVATNWLADKWTKADLPKIGFVEDFIDEWGGKADYQRAAGTVAAEATAKPPIYVL